MGERAAVCAEFCDYGDTVRKSCAQFAPCILLEVQGAFVASYGRNELLAGLFIIALDRVKGLGCIQPEARKGEGGVADEM